MPSEHVGILPSPIFAHLYAKWREIYASTRLDKKAFDRPFRRCDLAKCRGMCCYDGVYVETEVKLAIEALVAERKSELSALGAAVDGEVIVKAEWRGLASGWKTATRPFPFSREVERFPTHFNQTACVFHLVDGRCALQALAVKDGRHMWDYKPPTCWLHPIELNREVVTLYDEHTDPFILPEYPGYVSRTICGRSHYCGRPASEVLSEELSYLGGIIGRDIDATSAEETVADGPS